MMDRALEQIAVQVIAAAPCSVEMAAGTGKTQLVAASVAIGAHNGERSLVLTHTNAGVDAIQKRLARFGVSPRAVRVETITSWAFALVRPYPDLAGVRIASVPDWTKSTEYIEGAVKVASAAAVKRVIAASFDRLIVDEYQDCTVVQHRFVRALIESLPSTIVLGDHLQAIFGFNEVLVDWEQDVCSLLPRHEIVQKPHRWSEHNRELGDWLVSIRPSLVDGGSLDFASSKVKGLEFLQSERSALAKLSWKKYGRDETVIVLDKDPWRLAAHAKSMSGRYSIMEEVEGKFMRERLRMLPEEGSPDLASWLKCLAKDCFTGLGKLDRAVDNRLSQGKQVSTLKRDGLEPALRALDLVLEERTYDSIVRASALFSSCTGVGLYRGEGWYDSFAALKLSVETGDTPVVSLAHVRGRLRLDGRRSQLRLISRPLLVKGLEYDHVVIANVENFSDPRHLYVALSRARKSITVIGADPTIALAYA